ncbi:MAG: SGNH/GDSL hydrolase family protein [Elusimicrobiota bacterium]
METRRRIGVFFVRLCLFFGTLCLLAVGLEAALAVKARFVDEKHPTALGLSSDIPPMWAKRVVTVKGARHAYYWHGHLEVFDDRGMRRTTPFPPRRKGVGRVVVVGDSLTYGQGVEASDAYSAVLERRLRAAGYDVEVLNLGRNGYQSEDVDKTVREFVPSLHPDLIVYGICLNDFLESGRGIYRDKTSWGLPFPERWKLFLIERTRLARLMDRDYDGLLMAAGLRRDFVSDILDNFNDRQTRFARDLKNMNGDAAARGLPPITAMVLDQQPVLNGRLQRLARIAEGAARGAGMNVVATASYYERYSGHPMKVSPWEGHPNEEAHRIWADMLFARLVENPALARYRRKSR